MTTSLTPRRIIDIVTTDLITAIKKTEYGPNLKITSGIFYPHARINVSILSTDTLYTYEIEYNSNEKTVIIELYNSFETDIVRKYYPDFIPQPYYRKVLTPYAVQFLDNTLAFNAYIVQNVEKLADELGEDSLIGSILLENI